MRKVLTKCAFVLALLVALPASLAVRGASEAQATSIDGGDMYGAARIKCVKQAESDTGYVTELNVGGAGNGDFSGTGVYLRMKNYTGTDTPITMKFNSTNTAVFGPKTGVNQSYFDKDLNPVEGVAARGWGNYLMLPANFDGFIYMDYSTQMARIQGAETFDPSHMWRVYIEYSGFYDAYADFAIGNIYTDEKVVLDGSELDEEAFAATWINQTGSEAQTITQGYKLGGDMYGSARIKAASVAGSDTGYVTELNVGGAGNGDFTGTGVYLRMKNYTGTDTPITMKFNSTNTAIFGPKTGVKQSYFDKDLKPIEGIDARGWGNYLMLPANFDGFIYMNYSTQMAHIQGAETFDPSHMWRVYIEYSGFFDAYADFAIGDIFTDEKVVLDGSELDETAFASTWINQAGTAAQTVTQNPRSDAFIPSGDLLGGVHGKAVDAYGGFMVKQTALYDLTNGGVYIRIKNLNTSATALMLKASSNWFESNFWTSNGGVIHRYDAEGKNEETIYINEWGYFDLPASFNGFIHAPIESFGTLGWGTALDGTKINAIYFEATALNVEVGDIFSQDVKFYDGSEYYESEFASHTETWGTPAVATMELLDGFKPAPFVPFDYTQVEFEVALDRGVEVSAKQNSDSSVFSTASFNFAEYLDLSAGEAVAISFKANGTYAFGLEFYDKDNNALMMPAPGDAAVNPIYFLIGDTQNAINHTTGDPNTIHGIVGEGTMIIEKAFLAQKAGESFDWEHVASIKVRVHTFYDSGIIDVFGDIGTVDQTALTYTKVLDVSELLNWSTHFVADDEYIVVRQYSIPKPSEWIGDVKIIDHLTFRDDEEMYKTINLDDGDNPCSIERKESGIKVHAGPFETGHAYGSYMCLGLFDKGATTDRKQAYKMVGDDKVYAKGLTFFAKNLSAKEIGVTLQFDEKIPGKTYTERWCIVGYPAIYYAYDINTQAEYMLYSKSDQVQIPVGFEGYIRVPFESYSVPQWNQGQEGVDEILDLDNFSGDFFFTSDNTRYEDLEWELKDIGMYFNETRKGNMFDNSKTIKSNMGL